MCGIAGIYNCNTDEAVCETDLKRMADSIAHRGPDNQGIFVRRNAGLGYRRLSIIDTTEQEQPILTNEEQSLRIAFNGEIYNFPQLKEELLEKGHQFYTGTDTETILHLYEEEGPNSVKRLNGIFAVAILDIRNNSLFLARDQMGVKPLYYTYQDGKLAFASEIKALLTLPWVKREVNQDALPRYFSYRFIPDPLTMFAGIKKLEPGYWLAISSRGIETRPYWSLRKSFAAGIKAQERMGLREEETVVKQVREAVSSAVKRQLISDVPLGAFLSGGIDSSIVVAVMSQLMHESVKTFSIGFSESGFDESYYARQVAKRYGTDHHEIILQAQHVKKLPEVVYHLDEPLADPAAVPTFFLSQLARKEVTVVLTGEGGDELFAGYKEDFGYRLASLLRGPLDTRRVSLAGLVGKLPGMLGKTRVYRSLLPEKQRAQHILRDLFRFESLPLAYELARLANRDDLFTAKWQKVKKLDWLARMLYLESKIWLPGDPLMKVDKMTMAHALEARVPILDLEVVELAARIPSGIKNKSGVEKYLLRKAFEDVLPSDVFDRKKTAFELPLKGWLQNELKQICEEYLSEKNLRRSGFLDVPKVKRIIQLHQSARKDYKYEIWALLVFQIWYQRWFG